MLNKRHYNIKTHWSHTVKSDKHYQIGNTFILWVLHSEELSSSVCLQYGAMNGSFCLNVQSAGWIEPGSGKRQRDRKWGKAGSWFPRCPAEEASLWHGSLPNGRRTELSYLPLDSQNCCDQFPEGTDRFGNRLFYMPSWFHGVKEEFRGGLAL